MLLPILQCQLFGGVSITVLAKMWTGVILTNVLRGHALTELPLALVFLVLTDEVMVMRQEYCSFGQLGLAKQRWCRNFLYLYFHEVHQFLVVPSQTSDEVSIYTAIMQNAIFEMSIFSPQVASWKFQLRSRFIVDNLSANSSICSVSHSWYDMPLTSRLCFTFLYMAMSALWGQTAR